MLLKLVLILCLLVSVSLSVKVDSADPALFTQGPTIASGGSGNTGANPCYGHDEKDGSKDPAMFTQGPVSSGSGNTGYCPHHKSEAQEGGKKDITKEEPKDKKFGRQSSSGSGSGSGCGATGSTGTGSGRTTTPVNDGVTYKASNVKVNEHSAPYRGGQGKGQQKVDPEVEDCGEITGW
ncbi:hypothetical protein RB653_002028 [Dictyostelium firmibasis]|uniref:Uncharacterized protein n=1 Tax=Dictyostelium firmibasis TaxID=79012 RepID=A0AAN7TXU4_9MYCE